MIYTSMPSEYIYNIHSLALTYLWQAHEYEPSTRPSESAEGPSVFVISTARVCIHGKADSMTPYPHM